MKKEQTITIKGYDKVSLLNQVCEAARKGYAVRVQPLIGIGMCEINMYLLEEGEEIEVSPKPFKEPNLKEGDEDDKGFSLTKALKIKDKIKLDDYSASFGYILDRRKGLAKMKKELQGLVEASASIAKEDI